MRFTIIAGICLSLTGSFSASAQNTQAVISTTMNVIAPEDEDVSRMPPPGEGGGPGGFSMRNMGDGETKITTYVKDSMMKTIMKNEMGRTTMIRNNAAGTTISLIELMGNKMGFILTDADQADMKRKMDSMVLATRSASDSSLKMPASNTERKPAEIVVTDETKKIAGFECKKALVINSNLLGLKDTVAVWFAPDLKLQNVSPGMGNRGPRSFGNFVTLNGLDQLPGYAMQYEMKMRRGRIMQMEVTKVDLKKEIGSKDFEVPKDFEVKPYSEFQQMFRGMPQMRMDRQ